MKLKIKLHIYPKTVLKAIDEIYKYNPKILDNYLNIVDLYFTNKKHKMFNTHTPLNSRGPYDLYYTYQSYSVYNIELSKHFMFSYSPEGENFWKDNVNIMIKKKNET